MPTLLILSASLAWWFTEPKNARINLIAAAGAALFCWAVAPELCRHLSYSAYALAVDALAALRLDLVILRHAKMLVTGVAVVWYVKLCRVYIAAIELALALAASSQQCNPTGWFGERGRRSGNRSPSSSTSWASMSPTPPTSRLPRSEPMPPP